MTRLNKIDEAFVTQLALAVLANELPDEAARAALNAYVLARYSRPASWRQFRLRVMAQYGRSLDKGKDRPR